MSATLQGRRVPTVDELADPGDYCIEPRAVWAILPAGSWVRIPYADEPPPLWGFEEHEDGSVTLSPSIDHRAPGGNDGTGPDLSWHGWLERGVWRTA